MKATVREMHLVRRREMHLVRMRVVHLEMHLVDCSVVQTVVSSVQKKVDCSVGM